MLGWFVVPEDEAGPKNGESGDKAAQGAEARNSKSPGKADVKNPKGPAADPAVDDLIARYANAPTPAPARSAMPAKQGAGPGRAGQGGPSQTPPAAQTAQGGAGRGAAAAPITQEVPAVRAEGGPRVSSTPGAPLDFADIFKKQGLSADQQGHVERALMLLHNLPGETPAEIKRKIVEASLIAFGFPIDRIIESAALHLRALDRFTEKGQKETQALLDESTRRLQELEKEAERVRQVMQEQLHGQEATATACADQKRKVAEILEFFGKDAVERVRASSVKLRDG